jgi:hypothetical protein
MYACKLRRSFNACSVSASVLVRLHVFKSISRHAPTTSAMGTCVKTVRAEEIGYSLPSSTTFLSTEGIKCDVKMVRGKNKIFKYMHI